MRKVSINLQSEILDGIEQIARLEDRPFDMQIIRLIRESLQARGLLSQQAEGVEREEPSADKTTHVYYNTSV